MGLGVGDGLIEDMIAAAFDEADRRDPERVRQRVFLVDGNKQQLAAIAAQAGERGLKVPVLIDYPRQRLYRQGLRGPAPR